MPGSKRRHEDDFDFGFDTTFIFRDPEDVFREFFGGSSPFAGLFGKIFKSFYNIKTSYFKK